MKKKKLPSLSLKDISSRDISNFVSQSKHVLIGAVLVASISSCRDNDTTSYADGAADSYDTGVTDTGSFQDSYDVGAYDVADSDVTSYSDN